MSPLGRGFGLGTWILLALGGATLLARTRLGVWCGNQVRVLSDKVVIATIQLTSEFEKELPGGHEPTPGKTEHSR